MKVSRKFSTSVQYILDQLVPPIIRDSKWFMYLPMKLVFHRHTQDFMNFKDWFFKKDAKAIAELYRRTSNEKELQGETDLNDACVKELMRQINGIKVLEVGAGRGYLAGKLAAKNKVTACDIVVSDDVRTKYPEIKFVEADIESLPFKDGSFDAVVSTHTLEHVKNLPAAVSELKRVAKRELFIVVPKQRPYKYTFSLHTQFFPYDWSLQAAFGFEKGKTTIKDLDGDWFYKQKLS